MKIVQLSKYNQTVTLSNVKLAQIGIEHLYSLPIYDAVTVSSTVSPAREKMYWVNLAFDGNNSSSFYINENDILEFDKMSKTAVTVSVKSNNWDDYTFATLAYENLLE